MSTFNSDNSIAAQRNRILDFLRKRPFDKLKARKELDIMHPAARVMEIRKRDVNIKTMKIYRAGECGEIHRVACYVLEVGAGATAPVDEADGIHRQETDKSENIMGDAI